MCLKTQHGKEHFLMTLFSLSVLASTENRETDTNSDEASIAPADVSRALFGRLGVTSLPAHETLHLPVEQLLVQDTAHITRSARRLVKSIQQVGILQNPSVVVCDGYTIHDPKAIFEVMAGRRRVLAARFAGLSIIKCEVYASSTLPLSALLALIENMQRSAAWIQEVGALRQLLDEKVGLTMDDLAHFGFDRVHLAERLKMAQLPGSLLTQVLTGMVSRDVARKLVRLTSTQQERVAQLATTGEALTAESVKEVLRVQIASGLLPLQATLAQSVQTAPVASVPSTVSSSSTDGCASEEEVGEQTPPGGRLASLSMAGTTEPTAGQGLQDVLQALHLFQHCDTYRTLPRAIQTLTEALAQQVRLTLRSASVSQSSGQAVPVREEQDAQEQ
jgi:ParB-like chromosome segregation protein Spo0J